MSLKIPESWVNSYQRIANTLGGILDSRQVLWFDPAHFATSDNATAKRTEVTFAAASGLLPSTPPITQPPVLHGNSGASTGCILAFAAIEASSHISGVQMFADNAKTASDSDYVTWILWDVAEDGTHVGSGLASGSTKTIASGGSGDWVAGQIAIDTAWSGDIAAGHRLVVEWDTTTHTVAGTVPGGFWRTA